MTNTIGLTFTLGDCIQLSNSIICFLEHMHGPIHCSWHRNGWQASGKWMQNVMQLQIWPSVVPTLLNTSKEVKNHLFFKGVLRETIFGSIWHGALRTCAPTTVNSGCVKCNVRRHQPQRYFVSTLRCDIVEKHGDVLVGNTHNVWRVPIRWVMFLHCLIEG